MEKESAIPFTGAGKFRAVAATFFYRWAALLVILYGLFGLLFYLFILFTNNEGVTTGLAFRELHRDVLWIWLLVFAVLHLAVFAGGFFLLLYNKVTGYIFFLLGMSLILFANAIINNEFNYVSWGILLILGFFLWKRPKAAVL